MTSRPYRSPLRESQARATRRAVVEAARDLFVERGWSATTIDAVAERAGVSRRTVFTAVGGKAELLKIALDWALVGDDEPVPLSERPAWRRIAEGETPRDRAEAVGEVLVDLHRRTAPLHRALSHAAVGDEELGRLQQRDHAGIREQTRQGITAVARREPTELEVDLAMAVTSKIRSRIRPRRVSRTGRRMGCAALPAATIV